MSKRKSRVALASDSEGSVDSDRDHENSSKRTKPAEDEDATSDSGDEWGSKGKKKVLTKKSSPKNNSEDSDSGNDGEEGEISDEDSGDSDESEEFNDGYDENLIGDSDDRARLSQMTEKEREQELFNRVEKRERLKARFEIEKKLRKAKKKQRSKEKKQAPTDVSNRSKERKKNLEGKQDKKSQAIQILKAEREKKKKAEEERKEKDDTKSSKEQGALRKLKASDIYSDDDSSDSSSSGESTKKRSPPRSESRSRSASRSRSSSRSRSRSRSSGSDSDSASSRHSDDRVTYVNSKEQISRIRLSRFRLEKWLFTPFFTKTVIGCFVRIGIGQNAGQPKYRVAEIVDVVETPKIYQLGKNRTNKGLRLKHGKEERVFRIEYVSNQDFTDNEFNKWMEIMGVENLSLPSLSSIDKKQKDMEAANDHSYSTNDVNHIVEEKKKFKRNPVNYAMAKTEIMKKKEMAEQNGDNEEARRLTEEFDRLEDRAKELDKQRTSTISAISYINERNRQKNINDIERVIMEESRKNAKLKVEDPFTRRKCAPSLVTKKSRLENVTSTDQLLALEEVKRQDDEKRKADEKLKLEEEEKKRKQSGALGGRKKSEDLFKAHDFDITIDLDASIPAPVSNPIRSSLGGGHFLKDSAPRRSLNIEEYKKKRGLI